MNDKTNSPVPPEEDDAGALRKTPSMAQVRGWSATVLVPIREARDDRDALLRLLQSRVRPNVDQIGRYFPSFAEAVDKFERDFPAEGPTERLIEVAQSVLDGMPIPEVSIGGHTLELDEAHVRADVRWRVLTEVDKLLRAALGDNPLSVVDGLSQFQEQLNEGIRVSVDEWHLLCRELGRGDAEAKLARRTEHRFVAIPFVPGQTNEELALQVRRAIGPKTVDFEE